jgi:hypothetical protein
MRVTPSTLLGKEIPAHARQLDIDDGSIDRCLREVLNSALGIAGHYCLGAKVLELLAERNSDDQFILNY